MQQSPIDHRPGRAGAYQSLQEAYRRAARRWAVGLLMMLVLLGAQLGGAASASADLTPVDQLRIPAGQDPLQCHGYDVTPTTPVGQQAASAAYDTTSRSEK